MTQEGSLSPPLSNLHMDTHAELFEEQSKRIEKTNGTDDEWDVVMFVHEAKLQSTIMALLQEF